MHTNPRTFTKALFPAAALALLFIFSHSALRALDWRRTEIEQHAAMGAELAPYVFEFANSGSSAVTITDVRASCGCLAPELDRKIVPPGAGGKLTVRFDRTGLVGEIDRTVTVVTDEDRAAPYQLVLHANLPEPLTLAPRLVFWKKGAAPATKSIDIKVNLEAGIEVTHATSSRESIAVKLITLEARRHYRLEVTPRDTSEAGLAVIALGTAEKLPAGTALSAYAQVR